MKHSIWPTIVDSFSGKRGSTQAFECPSSWKEMLFPQLIMDENRAIQRDTPHFITVATATKCDPQAELRVFVKFDNVTLSLHPKQVPELIKALKRIDRELRRRMPR